MRLVIPVLLLSFATVHISGQDSTVKTSYDISIPNYAYGIKTSSIRDVNFKNLTVFWHPGDPTERGAKLQNGSFQHRHDYGFEGVDLDLLTFPNDESGASQSAIIDLHWKDCGGSCTELGFVQVFELRLQHPTVVQIIEYDRHAPETASTSTALQEC